MNAKRFLFIFVFFLLLTECFAIIEKASIPIFAVTESEDRAIEAQLTITIVPGSGKIWSSVGPLVGTSTQHTEKIAVELAKNYFKDVNKYDYLFDINSNASVVEGPSAGAAMALLLITMLQNKPLPGYVAITGQISEDGSVSSVGGVFAKAERAAESGIKLFMIPKGDAYQTHRFPDGIKTVNLVEYAPRAWGMKVVEVANIDEVLEYAFMDLNKIDVNTQVKEQEPFAPEAIPLRKNLEPMKELTARYITRAEKEIKAARDALNDSKLLDSRVVSALLDSLTNSQKNVEKAKLLYEGNYLYSAANYAFVSIVNARVVKDLANNPSLLKSESMLLDSWTSQLQSRVDELAEHLGKFYTLERFEWLVAAKERLAWAELTLQKISGTKTIIIGNNGIVEDISVPLKNLQDYEFALGWYEIASDFYNIAKEASDKFEAEPLLEDKAKEYIIKAENCVALLYEEDEDIKRRLDAAKLELKKGWYDAALFDAASAYGLCSSYNNMKGKSLSELIVSLETKIASVKNKLRRNEEAVWAELYIAHAEYFLKLARHLKEQNALSRAIENAKAGLNLALFADEILNAANYAKEAFEKTEQIPFTEPLPEISPEKPQAESESLNKLAVTAGIAIAMLIFGSFIVAILIIFLHKREGKAPLTEKEQIKAKIATLEKALHDLDRKLARNLITHESYVATKRIYEEQLKLLKEELSRKSKQLLEIDRHRAQLKELQFMLDQIKEQYQAGELLEEDYKKAVKEYVARLERIQNELATEEKQLVEEEQKIKKLAKSLKRPSTRTKGIKTKSNKRTKRSPRASV